MPLLQSQFLGVIADMSFMELQTPEGREFTPTENRIVQMVLNQVFEDMREAWHAVLKVDFEYLSSEVNPAMANIVSPGEGEGARNTRCLCRSRRS